MTTAVVFDYGFGNVRSMVRASANLGVDNPPSPQTTGGR